MAAATRETRLSRAVANGTPLGRTVSEEATTTTQTPESSPFPARRIVFRPPSRSPARPRDFPGVDRKALSRTNP